MSLICYLDYRAAASHFRGILNISLLEKADCNSVNKVCVNTMTVIQEGKKEYLSLVDCNQLFNNFPPQNPLWAAGIGSTFNLYPHPNSSTTGRNRGTVNESAVLGIDQIYQC